MEWLVTEWLDEPAKGHVDGLTDRLTWQVTNNDLNYLLFLIHQASVALTIKKWQLLKNRWSKKKIFWLHPWIPALLQIVVTDKLVDKNPWNFDTKNVKQYATRGKKEEIIILTMRGTPSIQNKSVVIEDTVSDATNASRRCSHSSPELAC